MAADVQWPKLVRTARLLKLGALRCPLLLLSLGSVIAALTSPPAAAAPKAGLCNFEKSYVDSNFGTGWETATNTPTACELGITSKNGFAQELAFNSVLEGTLYASGLSAEAQWQAAHTPGSHEQIWILPHLGRLAPDGSSALGDIPGHGNVTAIFWNSGIPKNSIFSIHMEVADGYSIVSTLTSQWPVPIGSPGVDTYPQAHQNAIKSLADRLLPLFYTKSKPKSAV